MNDLVSARLQDLRTAASDMSRSADSLRLAAERVHTEVDGLVAQVDPSGSSAFAMLAHSGRLDALIESVAGLASQLARAADDIESAGRWHGPPLGILWDRLGGSARISMRPPEATAAPPAYTLGNYVSRANRPLYDQLLADQAELADRRAQVAEAEAARTAALEERGALLNRLVAYGTPEAAALNDPRVRGLDATVEAATRDAEEASGQATVLEHRIEGTTQRLLAVTPPDAADPAVIRSLEGGQSESYVLANTRDCVNYVASRVPIPGELAANAHLWDERAAELSRFGIRTSDTPLAGSILVLETDHPYADDRYGHVALVEYVDSAGGVWITDNNHAQPVRLDTLTSETTGDRVKYLYLPWYTKA
ncbi:MAG: CHAP domain-containing protein [Chloroflexi bacterium]|nr:CHAP domain-containing protein [Chloroflexota bacterium]